MELISSRTKLPLMAGIVMMLTGCSNGSPVQIASASSPTSAGCQSNSVVPSCIMQNAKLALGEITDPENWVSAASEYAIGLQSIGDTQNAIAILDEAAVKTGAIEAIENRLKVMILTANSYAKLDKTAKARDIAERGESLALQIESNGKRSDIIGKLISVRAQTGQFSKALSRARAMPQSDATESAFKARTLREIAVYQAENKDFSGARKTLEDITMGLTYYRSTARSDIATLAFADGQHAIALTLLGEAEQIARAQDDGYFIAGALRDIGKSFFRGGYHKKAMGFFEDAKSGARQANSYQEKARSLSRIGTGLADCGLHSDGIKLFPQTIKFADQAKSETFKNYSYYEIAGSAAFAGDFDTARRLAELIPAISFGDATSLKDATKRDIVWGLARHNRLDDALDLARTISEPRERVQALSRLMQLQADPDMEAFSRYL